MATVLLSDLTTRISQILDITISAKFFWTDSTIVLHWLSKPATHWQIFVGNRVAQIQSNCNIDQWRLVNGVDNPADIVSRGMSPEQLSKCTLWWHGPHWLTKNSNNWPGKFQLDVMLQDVPETRKRVTTTITNNN